MNKHLNNWLDKVEGLPEGTSNRNIEKEIKRQKISHCDGVHASVEDIIKCKDCSEDIDNL